jgi:hypothetical protein
MRSKILPSNRIARRVTLSTARRSGRYLGIRTSPLIKLVKRGR